MMPPLVELLFVSRYNIYMWLVTQKQAIWEDIDEIEIYTEANSTVFHLQFDTKMNDLIRKLIDLHILKENYPSR